MGHVCNLNKYLSLYYYYFFSFFFVLFIAIYSPCVTRAAFYTNQRLSLAHAYSVHPVNPRVLFL